MHGVSSEFTSADTTHQIAVIGMAGRFPGATDIAEFWGNLVEGKETIRHWTREELLAMGVPAEQLDLPDFVPAGAPLKDAGRFDAAFFGYSPAEAEILDPQQRLFLESAWSALETAGYCGDRYKGAVGVYAAAGVNTYMLNLHDNAHIRDTVSPYEVFVANDKDFLASRAAFKLNLRGPAITVQTACSSSLVAVHMAAQALLAGECDMALAGGVSLARANGYRAREGSILSADGHCRAFDERAGGTVPGSGIGVVVLKRLDDAIADGDPIEAVLLGSAINNDGALKASFTAPQVDGQAAVIADAQAAAGVRADSIGYVEAHGTGTVLGDPIEIAALTQAFRQTSSQRGFCAIGSVKTNIGHLDTAAGIAGFIKAVLSVKHGKITPSLHYARANPRIDFEASPFFVNDRLRDWQAAGPRRAGVSSFGIGGTNAHAVLQEPPARKRSVARPGPHLLSISARSAKALSDSAAALAARLDKADAPSLADVALTLRDGRADFPHRQYVTASDAKTAAQRLRALSEFGLSAGSADPVLLFPGQGSQRPGMGKSLYAGLEVFRRHIDDCAARLDGLMQRDFRAMLFDDGDAIHGTELAQPALFAVEYALAKSWMSFGLAPRALHGHSIGEYVAACLAGVFDLDDALRLVVERGRLMQAAVPGAMLTIMHPDQDIAAFLGEDIALAAANAPGLSVVSGPLPAIHALQARLEQQGLVSRLLKTSHAFHSPMMNQAADALRKTLASIRFSAPAIPLISNVTGTWMSDEQALSPDYWAEHLLAPVRFADSTRTLLASGNPVFIEVGPGTALTSLTRETGGPETRAIGGLSDKGDADEYEQLLGHVGRFWQMGGAIDAPVAGDARRVALPTYPFEGDHYWIEPDTDGKATKKAPAAGAGLYRTAWQRSTSAAPAPMRLRGRVLIFDDGRLGETLAAELERGGAEPYRVVTGEGFDEVGYRCFSVRPQSQADYHSLVETLEERGGLPDRIIVLWPLAAQITDAPAYDHARSLLNIVRAASNDEKRITLTVLTAEAEDVTGLENSDSAQAMVGGVMLVVAQEYPHLTCRRIDIDHGQLDAPESLARRIRAELAGESAVTALRGMHRWLPTLERFELPQTAPAPRLAKNGVYAVVGDIGAGVGKEWLDALSALPDARLAAIEDHASAGEFHAGLKLRINCADAAELDRAFSTVAAEWGRIDGVFLSLTQSNEKSAALIGELNDQHWAYNTATKLAPLQALETALARRKIGFCCVQSSLATTAGGLSLAAYRATYHALDRIVAQKNRTGATPWFAIGYPLLEEARPGARRLSAFSVAPAEAWELTRRILDNGHFGQTTISGSDVAQAAAQTAKPGAAAQPQGARRRPELPVAYAAPQNPAEAAVVEIFEGLLGIEGIGVNDGFYELGGHSLLAIRAVAKLREAFPVEVEMRELLFDNPTASAIAAAVTARMAATPDLDAMAALLDQVDNLSDEEVSRLLAGTDA